MHANMQTIQSAAKISLPNSTEVSSGAFLNIDPHLTLPFFSFAVCGGSID
jgi:hypothetical protein